MTESPNAGLFKRQVQHVAKVGSAKHLAAPTAAAPAVEDVAEHIAKNVAERVAAAGARTCVTVYGIVAEAIVSLPLLRVLEHFVRGTHILEPRFGVRIARIAIRVILHGQALVGLLDLRVRRRFVDTERSVKIFGHTVLSLPVL